MSNTHLATPGCRVRGHWKNRWQLYEALPAAIRRRLMRHNRNVCPGCVSARVTREGVAAVALALDLWRCTERTPDGCLELREDLRP